MAEVGAGEGGFARAVESGEQVDCRPRFFHRVVWTECRFSLFHQRIFREGKLRDDFPADQVLLDDALQHFWGTRVIPDALRVNHGDRPADADAKAVRLGPENFRREPELLEPPLEVFPRFQPGFLRAALRLGLIRAEEDVTLDFLDAKSGGAGVEVVHSQDCDFRFGKCKFRSPFHPRPKGHCATIREQPRRHHGIGFRGESRGESAIRRPRRLAGTLRAPDFRAAGIANPRDPANQR